MTKKDYPMFIVDLPRYSYKIRDGYRADIYDENKVIYVDEVVNRLNDYDEENEVLHKELDIALKKGYRLSDSYNEYLDKKKSDKYGCWVEKQRERSRDLK